MGVRTYLVRRVAESLNLRQKGIPRHRLLEFMARDALSALQLRVVQDRNLRQHMIYAREHCAFYRKLFAEVGVDCNGPDIRAEIRKVPPISKALIQQHLDELISDEHQDRKDLIPKVTGGSTGNPLQIYGDKEDYRVNNIVIARQRRWIGWIQGMSTLTLFGGFRDKRSVRRLQWKQWLLNDTTVNVMDSSTLDYSHILDRLRNRPPEILVGYFGILKQLALLAENQGRPVAGIRVAMACGEPVTETGRTLVERWLGTDMFAQYGSREIGTMGQECRRKDGYHYAQDVALMEVLDEKDEPTEHGNLVITYFGNQVVPLIRYLTGDAASIDTRPCECGLPYERVRNIDGRIASMIQLKDGRCLTSLILPHVFKDYIWIHEFQVEQRAPGSLVIRIQRSDTGFTAESFTKLQATVVSLWGSNMELEWRYNVPFLQVPTGKHVQFISTFSTAEASGEQCAS